MSSFVEKFFSEEKQLNNNLEFATICSFQKKDIYKCTNANLKFTCGLQLL